MSTQALDANLAATPTASAVDQSDADVLTIVQAVDAGKPMPTAPPATSTAPETPTDTPPAAGDKSALPAGDKAAPATDKKPDDKKPTDQKPNDKAKPDTAFQKAQKEAERKDKSWKALEEEKARVREKEQKAEQALARVTTLEQELATLKASKPAAPATPLKDEHGISAETYEALAKKYEEEGDNKTAALARSKAEKLRTPAAPAATAAAAPQSEPWKAPEFQQKWNAEAAALVKEDPELGKNDNPVFQRVNQLVNDPATARFFRADPAGLRAAVQVAKLEQTAARLPALEKALGEKDAEIKRLNALLQPRGGLPAAPAPGTRTLDEMNDSEREAHVLAAAAAADRGGT